MSFIFEDLINKASGEEIEPEAFEALLEKAFKLGGSTIGSAPIKAKDEAPPAQFFSSKKASAAPAASKTKKVPIKKIATPQGSAVSASTKTSHQINSELNPQSQMVATPDGPKRVTYHGKTKAATPGKSTIYVPPGKSVVDETNPITKKKKKGNEEQAELEHVRHQDGGTVVAGAKDGQIPHTPEFTHKGRYYHDNLRLGDKIRFLGKSKDYPDWPGAEVESEVSALNPDGQKIIHMKQLHRDLKDDPDAPPMPLNYEDVRSFRRRDEQDPHKWHHFEYSGEFDSPEAGAPEGAAPQQRTDPNEAFQHSQKVEEIKKQKADTAGQLAKPGDYVEFWYQDPVTQRHVLRRGTVKSRAIAPEPEGSAGRSKGKGGKGKDGDEPQVTHLSVHTEEAEPVDVELHDIHRIGKMLHKDLHMFKFDPNKMDWANEGVAPSVYQQHGVAETSSTGQPQTQTPAQPGEQEKPESEVPPTEPAFPHTLPPHEEKDRAKLVMDGGAQYIGEEDGQVMFNDPETGDIHSIPSTDLSSEAVRAKMGKKHTEAEPQSGFAEEKEPAFDIRSHWTHRLHPKAVNRVLSLIDKVDSARQKGNVPANVLAARHQLLTNHDQIAAAKAASVLNGYLENPNRAQLPKPEPKLEDFQNKFFTPDLENIQHHDVVSRLGTNKASIPFLKKQQLDAIGAISKAAEQAGFGDISKRVQSIDPSKDNRQVLHFYKQLIANKAKQAGQSIDPIKARIPQDEHIEQAHHLNEMSNYLEKQRLNVPAYNKKMQHLNYLLEHDPNSPLTNVLFNQLHSYAYDRGETDPYYKLHSMWQQISKTAGKKIPPDVLERISNRMNMVEEGNINPEVGMDKTLKDLEDHGIKIKMPEADSVDSNRGLMAREHLNNLVSTRELQEKHDQVAHGIAKDEQAAEEQKQRNAQDVDGATIPEAQQIDVKGIQANIKHIEHLMKDQESFISDVDANENPTKENIYLRQKMMENLENNIRKHEEMRKQVAEGGVELPQYKSDVVNKKTAREMDDKRQVSESHAKAEDYSRTWLRDQVSHAKNELDVIRHHFFSHPGMKVPEVQRDMKTIDDQVSQNMQNNNWQPISPTTARTPVGQAFVAKVNKVVQDILDREKLTGIPLQQALAQDLGKSLADTLSSEKTLARRDISLALRKAFYNDKDSEELRRATNLMASYFDDLIDALMKHYPNIPLTVRKSMTRKMLKAVITDVVKDNRFSAASMEEDFTAPLSDDVIRSMGREVAGLVTEFRMNIPSQQPFLIVGKVTQKAIKRPAEWFETTHNVPVIKSIYAPTPEEWLAELISLENDMHKAGCFAYRVSPSRIKKFVADNDSKTLEDFYNSNIKELSDRLSEIKNGNSR